MTERRTIYRNADGVRRTLITDDERPEDFTVHTQQDIEPIIVDVVRKMTARSVCLVHGDFSPKNVLVGTGAPWVLAGERSSTAAKKLSQWCTCDHSWK